MPIVDPFGMHVVARLLDFFGVPTPWYRRLWCPGAVLALREVLEASHAVRAAILSEDTFGSVVRSATALTGPDPGIGSKTTKRALQQALDKKTIVPDGVLRNGQIGGSSRRSQLSSKLVNRPHPRSAPWT